MTDLKAPQVPGVGGETRPPAIVYPVYRDEDAISLLEIASWFYAERYLVAAIVGAAVLTALTLAFALPPVYRAEALVAPASQARNEGVSAVIGQLGDIAALVGDVRPAATDRRAEFIASLRSRVLALEFIRAHDLKPRLFPARWDGAKQAWRDPAGAPSDLEAYRLFDGRVRHVDVDRRTGLVSLAIEWKNPELAAQWANRLVAEVNARQRAAVVREARESIEYLERQLAGISSVEVRRTIYRLIESQMKTMALARAREEYAFKVIDPAVPPERPSAPRPMRLVVAGLCLGIVLAVVVVLMKRAVRAFADARDKVQGTS